MPRHGVAGAVIGNRFHLESGMITSAGAMAMLDPKLEVHTASHEVLVIEPQQGQVIAKLGGFGGIDRDGAPIGFLWSNSLVFHGDHVLNNLA